MLRSVFLPEFQLDLAVYEVPRLDFECRESSPIHYLQQVALNIRYLSLPRPVGQHGGVPIEGTNEGPNMLYSSLLKHKDYLISGPFWTLACWTPSCFSGTAILSKFLSREDMWNLGFAVFVYFCLHSSFETIIRPNLTATGRHPATGTAS